MLCLLALLSATLSTQAAPAMLTVRVGIRATGADFIDCENRRSLFSIVWGCFTTIFACVWVSAHPNVPPPIPPPPGKGASLWQHLKWQLPSLLPSSLSVLQAGSSNVRGTSPKNLTSVVLGAVPVVVLWVYADGALRYTGCIPFSWVFPVYVAGVLLYVPARLALTVLPLVALRALPDAVYSEVKWNRYLPHV
ncbi:hypothetical protein MIND_00907200 [Mycena indigotica]|uniref:Uncharacterized protein n=1 Tax=Mycena indigotica TaxID=2126181 RepID=A0A8H6SC14_9AGAR|nr:uncharacterized protein MIND_00907200 [Mycena indigotica]KAF7296765.1 hypothetical protein MIND_00907200 [Mycena indigotica]